MPLLKDLAPTDGTVKLWEDLLKVSYRVTVHLRERFSNPYSELQDRRFNQSVALFNDHGPINLAMLSVYEQALLWWVSCIHIITHAWRRFAHRLRCLTCTVGFSERLARCGWPYIYEQWPVSIRWGRELSPDQEDVVRFVHPTSYQNVHERTKLLDSV